MKRGLLNSLFSNQVRLAKSWKYNKRIFIILNKNGLGGNFVKTVILFTGFLFSGLTYAHTAISSCPLIPVFGPGPCCEASFALENTFAQVPDDISAVSLDSLDYRCPGIHTAAAKIRNMGSTIVDSVIINWSVNGLLQTPVTYRQALDTTNGTGSADATVTLGDVTLVANQPTDIKVWTSAPNGNPDQNPNNDTIYEAVSPALGGIFTIDPSGSDPANFVSLADAIAALQNNGVCAPVTINIVEGIYNEQVSIGNISGTSFVNTVTFQPYPSNTGPVVLTDSASLSQNFIWQFKDASHVHLKGLTLSALDPANGGVVIDFTGSNSHIVVEDNILNGLSTTSTSTNYFVLKNNSGSSNDVHFSVIRKNRISGGSAGIYWYGIAESGNIIERNEIRGYYSAGLFGANQENFRISENRIFTAAGGNNVYNMRLGNLTGSPSSPNIVGNNMIGSDSGSGTAYGLYITDSPYLDIVYNSIYVRGSAPAIYLDDDVNNIKVLNNNILNDGSGPAIEATSEAVGSGIDRIDHNNYYVTGNSLIKWAGASVETLLQWNISSGRDSNSLNIDPAFLAADSLYTTATPLNNKATPYPGITADFYGIPRPATPDIGAHEFPSITGQCNAFSGFSTDITDTSLTANWIPGNGNNSFYLEYGPAGFSPGGGTLITGNYPGSQPPVFVNGLSQGAEYDIYFGELCNSGGDSSYIDGKWRIKTALSCPPIGMINLDHISHDSAAFSFLPETDAHAFDYEYGPTGYVQGTGTEGTFDGPAGLGGLSHLTHYDIYIRGNCTQQGKGISSWYGPFTFRTECEGPLSGIYTLDKETNVSDRNFHNFESLMYRLKNCGISAPVTAYVKEGVYEEQVYMASIPGASSENPIVIQAHPSNTSAVEIKYDARSRNDNYVWKFDSTSFTTVKGLEITAVGSTGYGTAVDFSGTCEQLVLEHNKLTSLTNSANSNVIQRVSAGNQIKSVTIRHNEISGGHNGIYWYGSSYDPEGYDKGNTIDSNTIDGFTYSGLALQSQDSISATGNIITTSLSSDNSAYGANISYVRYLNCIGNKIDIQGSSKLSGLFIRFPTGDSSKHTIVANNMISVFDSTGRGLGIHLDAGNYADIVYNSVWVRSGTVGESAGIQLEGGNDKVEVLNNCVVNTGGGVAIKCDPVFSTSVLRIDYNNYFVSGINVGLFDNIYAASLADWNALTGNDSASLFCDPLFAGTNDLHVSSPLLKRAGTPYPAINTDFDGDQRSATVPDIGADEFSLSGCIPSVNMAVVTIYSDSVTLSWKPGTGNTYNLWYGPQGFFQDTSLTGHKITGITDTFYTLPGLTPQTVYDIYVSDYCGSTDTSIWYSSVTVKTVCTGILPAGVYTIDGNQADGNGNFSSFPKAAKSLVECGINGPVIFHVAPGTYTENLILTEIPGASFANTVVFDGGDPLSVLLTDSSETSIPTVYFNGADHITLKNITISNTRATDAWGVLLQDSANYNTIDSCHIKMPITSTTDVIGILASSSLSGESAGNNAHYLTVSHCRITGGEAGITLMGGSFSAEANLGHILKNNVLRYQHDHAIDADGVGEITITGNDIDSLTNAVAVNLSDIDNYEISGNKIISPNIGLYINDGNDGTHTAIRSKIINNIIITQTDFGIHLNDFEETDLFYNSIVGLPAILIRDQINMDIRNNIFYSPTDYALECRNEPASGDVINYNLYYSGDSSTFSIGRTTYADLTAWQLADPSRNVNSLSGDPAFISPASDLHIVDTSIAVDAADTSVVLATDIDGDQRPSPGSSGTDIGADEFTYCSLLKDIHITALGCDSVVLNWLSSGAGYSIVEYGLSGFSPGSGSVLFAAAPLTLNNLNPGTSYDVYFSDTCGTDTIDVTGSLTFTTTADSTLADFNIVTDPPGASSQTISFDASTSIGAHTYQWNFGDGNSGNGMVISHSYTANGTYSAQLVVTGDCGRDTTTQEVVISGISLEESILSRSLEVYPNPTAGRIQLIFETHTSEEVNIRLSDLSGKIILEHTVEDINGRYKGEINMEQLSKGTYMLQLYTSGIEAVRRIVKQ